MRIMRHTAIQSALVGALIMGLTVLAVACGGSSSTTTTVSPSTTLSPSTTASPSTIASPTTSVASSGTSTGSSVPATGAEATIKANWEKFFDGTLPAQDKVGLLENGQQYTAQIQAQAASPLAKAATASVSSVTVTSPTTATVTYSILVSGQAALPNQTGQAVLQDGVWKVSAQSFLALLALNRELQLPRASAQRRPMWGGVVRLPRLRLPVPRVPIKTTRPFVHFVDQPTLATSQPHTGASLTCHGVRS